MDKIYLQILLFIVLLLVPGCATLPGVKSIADKHIRSHTASMTESVYVNSQPREKGGEMLTLKCRSAHRLGCRHQGRIYPWNAWVELQGRRGKYEIVDVRHSGNRAEVIVQSK